MSNMQVAMDNMSASIHKRMEEFEAQLQKSASTPATLTSLAAEFAGYRAFVTQALNMLQNQLEVLTCSVDRMETQRRRKILLLHGVQEVKEENVVQTVTNIVKQYFGASDFSDSNIKRCQRLGQVTSNKKPRPILVKLLELNVRDKLWFSKTALKGSGITVSEFLTKARHDVFMAARERFGVTKTWTKEGCVYVQGPGDVRHRVASLTELNNIGDTLKSNVVTQKSVVSKTKRSAATKK